MKEEIEKTVKALLDKATSATHGVEAMQFTQAALNATQVGAMIAQLNQPSK